MPSYAAPTLLATAKIPAPFTPTQVVDAVKSFGSDANMGTVQQYLLALQAKNIICKVRRGAYPLQTKVYRY